MADTLTPEQEKRFEWTFEDYRNKESLAYMVATIGDVKKLKQLLASEIAKAKAEERDKMREIIGEDEEVNVPAKDLNQAIEFLDEEMPKRVRNMLREDMRNMLKPSLN